MISIRLIFIDLWGFFFPSSRSDFYFNVSQPVFVLILPKGKSMRFDKIGRSH